MCDTGYYGYENVNIMVHAAIGYLTADLAGSKSSFSNALAAGVNKFVTEEILKDEKTYKHYQEHPEELQWISAALGAAIGQMAGGDATSGASIASSATKNNGLFMQLFQKFVGDDFVDLTKTPEGKAAVVGFNVDITYPIKAALVPYFGPEILVIPIGITYTDTLTVYNNENKDKFSNTSISFGKSLLPFSLINGIGHLEDPYHKEVTDNKIIEKQLQGFSFDTSFASLLLANTSINSEDYRFIVEGVNSDLGFGVGFGGTWKIDNEKKQTTEHKNQQVKQKQENRGAKK